MVVLGDIVSGRASCIRAERLGPVVLLGEVKAICVVVVVVVLLVMIVAK